MIGTQLPYYLKNSFKKWNQNYDPFMRLEFPSMFSFNKYNKCMLSFFNFYFCMLFTSSYHLGGH